MAQGNPFQDWGGGQSASDEPFSQFPFQHPKTQQGVSDPVQGQPLQLMAPTTYAPSQGPSGQHMTPRTDLLKLQPASGVRDSGHPAIIAKDNPFDSVFGHGPLARGPPASSALFNSQQGGAGGSGLGGGAGAPTSSNGLTGPSGAFMGGVGHHSSIRTVPAHQAQPQAQPQAHLQPQATQHPSSLTLQQPPGHDGILVPYRNQQQADQMAGSVSIGADGGAARGTVGGGGMRASTPDGPAPSPTGVEPGAMVPFGHPFASPQNQQAAQGARGAAHAVAQGSLVPYSPVPNRSQQQNQGWGHQGGVVGVAGGPQAASNPFDDLFTSNVPASTPRGNPGFTTSGVTRQPQQHPPQPKPQQWNVQQYPPTQQQHPQHQHQVQDWSPVSKGVEGLTISARDQPVVTRRRSGEYSPFHNNQVGQHAWQQQAPGQGWPSHPHQMQQKEQMQQQPQYGPQYPGGQAFLGSSPQPPNRSFAVDAYNPFFASSPGGETAQQQPQPPQTSQPQSSQQVTPTAGKGDPYPGKFGVFSDDPFRTNKSALTTTDEGFIAVGGRSTTLSPPGSSGGPNSTPQKPPDGTNTGSGAYAPSAPSSTASVADPFDPFDIPSVTPKSGGNAAVTRGRWATRSAASARLSTTRNLSGIFPSKSSSDDRAGRDTGRRKRSSSVPRIPEGRNRASESDPFHVNTGRHALEGRSLDDSDRGGGGRGGGSNGSPHEGGSAHASTFGRKNSFSRSHTMGDLAEPGRGRGNTRELGSRGMAGGSVVRGRSQRLFHSRVRQEDDDNDDDDDGFEDPEEEEDLGGSDSDNDDTISVMDPDAMRAAIGRGRGGHGAGGREGDGRNWRGHGNGGDKDGSGGGPSEYVVEFERERKLGMLLERHDEWADGSEARSERAVVKMVVDNGPAQTRGVTVGSKVKKVNGESVTSLTYQETLERIKHASRPLRVHFERGELVVDDNAGTIMFKKTVGVPLSYSAWQRRYYVLGGAVAKSHVLQIYGSKQSYDRMVLAVFGRQRINERVKAYKLNYQFKCGPIRVKKHKAHPSPLHCFTIKIPTSRLKQLNFASHSLPDLEHLRNSISRYTSKS